MSRPILEQPIAASSSLSRLIPRLQLTPWPEQPRQEFSKDDQERLRASLKEHGFDEAYPLLCRPLQYKSEEVDLGGFNISYRTHETTPWKIVQDDITFPVGPAWAHLETKDDVEMALAWLPKFQIVDGERRWTESGELSIHEVPCVVREMTDKEALEKALISALQKKSLNALEEAEGFGRMMAMESGSTAKAISLRLGVSLDYVTERLSIRILRGTEAGKAIVEGRIGLAHGRLLAKLPTREKQAEWTKKVLANPWGPSPMSYRDLDKKLREDEMKELRGCGFDTTDASLVPLVQHEGTGERIMGGACTDCPFNSRNIEVEEEGMKTRNHMCLNLLCFRTKQGAAHEQWRESVKPHSSLALTENDALWADSGVGLVFHSPYVEIEERPHDLDLKPTVVCNEPWKKLIKGQQVEIIAARDGKGKTHLLARKELAIAAAHENKHHIFKKEAETPTPTTVAEPGAIPAVESAAKAMHAEETSAADKAAKEQAEIEAERLWLAQIAELVRSIGKSKKVPEGFFEVFFELFGGYFADGRTLAGQRRDVDPQALAKTVAKGDEMGMAALFMEVLLLETWWIDTEKGDAALKRAGKIFEAKLADAKKDELKKIKEEKAEATKAGDITGGMKWKPRPCDEEFRFNSPGKAENPDRCELEFPKALKITASISLAWSKGEWVVGWFVQGPKFGTSEPCHLMGVKYSERPSAVRAGLLAVGQELKKGSAPEEAQARVMAWIESIGAPMEEKKPAAKKKAKAASSGKTTPAQGAVKAGKQGKGGRK